MQDIDDVSSSVSKLLGLMILTIFHIIIVKLIFVGMKLYMLYKGN